MSSEWKEGRHQEGWKWQPQQTISPLFFICKYFFIFIIIYIYSTLNIFWKCFVSNFMFSLEQVGCKKNWVYLWNERKTFYGIKNKVGLEIFHFNLTSDSSKVYAADIPTKRICIYAKQSDSMMIDCKIHIYFL